MRKLCFLIFLLAGLMASTAQGRESTDSVEEIMVQQQSIREGIQTLSGRYADMPLVKRSAIIAEQDKLFGLLEGEASTNDLDPVKKTEAINALEAIYAAIDSTEDERIVCKREKKTGTQLMTRVCKSVAQMRSERAAGRASLESKTACYDRACFE
jgi:hypothetical protein